MSASLNSDSLGSPVLADKRERSALNRFLGVAAVLLVAAATGLPVTLAADVPIINGQVGPCSADFTVTDSSNKPVYDAKIHVLVRYGIMNKRKSDLEIGTNSDGKARFEGLPDKVKKPLEFQIRSGEQTKSVTHNPAADCHANLTVVLGTP